MPNKFHEIVNYAILELQKTKHCFITVFLVLTQAFYRKKTEKNEEVILSD